MSMSDFENQIITKSELLSMTSEVLNRSIGVMASKILNNYRRSANKRSLSHLLL